MKAVQNCSFVYYDIVNYIISDESPHTPDGYTRTHWVAFEATINSNFNGDTYLSSSNSYAGTKIYGQMRNNSESWFKGLMMHEIGHSFGLDHAFNCDTVMGGNDNWQ